MNWRGFAALSLSVAVSAAALAAATTSAGAPEPVLVFVAHASTSRPIAGHPFTAAVAVARFVQNREPWTLVCRVQLRGYTINPHVQKFGLPRQLYDSRSCSFVVPRGSAGRLLHLTYFAMSQGPNGCSPCGSGSGGTKTWRIRPA